MFLSKQKASTTRNHVKRALLITVTMLLLISVAVLILEVTNTTYWFHARPRALTASPETKGEPIQKSTNPDSQADESPSQTGSNQNFNDKSNEPSSSLTLMTPSGDFINTHKAPLSIALSSVCTTTPGATCIISFINGDTVKSLEPHTTDRGGSAYWDRITPKSIGLTPGAWTVTATAKLGNQNKSASDALKLEVTQ